VNRQRFNEVIANHARGGVSPADVEALMDHVNESLGHLEIPTALPGDQIMAVSQEAMRTILQHYLRQLPFHRGGCPDVIRVETVASRDSEYPAFVATFLEPVKSRTFE
jgi:hypothetical protein